MSSLQPPQVECKWCGARFPEGTGTCPQCGRPVPPRPQPSAYPSPTGRGPAPLAEPIEPALGRGSPGFLENAWQIVSADKALMAVLALQALNVVLAVISGGHFRIILSGLTFFGLVTFQRWGYWLTMVGSGLGLLIAVPIALSAAGALATGSAGARWADATAEATFLATGMAAIYAFIIVVLYTRRDQFG